MTQSAYIVVGLGDELTVHWVEGFGGFALEDGEFVGGVGQVVVGDFVHEEVAHVFAVENVEGRGDALELLFGFLWFYVCIYIGYYLVKLIGK